MPNRALLPLLLIAVPALALAANGVPLPRERPVTPASSEAPPSSASSSSASISSSSSASAEDSVPLPRERPAEMAGSPKAPGGSAAGGDEPVPAVPPPREYQVACPAVMSGQVTARAMPPIHEGQCGIQSPLALEAVSANGRSIPLSATVTTDCGMATALPAWVAEVDSYVSAHDRTTIAEIEVSTSYACRNVDNAATGNLSFHAFADALDIVGFALADGRRIDIRSGWRGTPEQGSAILHFARDAACTHFMTVLGPDADQFHQDNMHLDLACHGRTCTSRLCE